MKKYNKILICAAMAAVLTAGCGSLDNHETQTDNMAGTGDI